MSKRRVIIAAAAVGFSVLAFAQAAQADTQNFPKPGYKGHLLDWCFSWANDCGKHPADAWCQSVGFEKAQSFNEWVNPGISTRLIGSNQVCDEPECDAYANIVCAKPGPPDTPDEETFKKPKFKGMRLDWCLSWATDCGKPAADAYCDWKGFSKSSDFQIAPDIGLTRIISSGQVCSDPGCDGFKFITCQ